MTYRGGQLFGNYRLIRLLGQGNFADVYLAEHIYLKTEVAVKVLQVRLTESSLAGFLSEARTIASLTHPHIVSILDFGVQDDCPYLVMTYAPQGSMRQQYPTGTVLPPENVVTFVKQVADALQYAHDRKIIHRDINPANLLLNNKHEVLISDFGIAILAHRTRSWVEQNVAGTAVYMAPEQFQARAIAASDQYALGIVTYEWLVGTPPFRGNFLQLSYQHNFTPSPPLHDKMSHSHAIEEVVLKAIAKNAEDRFERVQDFAEALEQSVQASRSDSPHKMSAFSSFKSGSTPLIHEMESTTFAPPTPPKASTRQNSFSRRGIFFTFLVIGFLLIFATGGILWHFAFSGSRSNNGTPRFLTVTTLVDDAPGSLRQTINEAQPGDTIIFASNIRGTIMLTVDDLVISKNLTIQGPGAGNLSISFGTINDRIYIAYGTSVSISDLSFKGSHLIGSSILTVRGTLTLTKVVVSDNSSQGGSGGIDNRGTLILNSSTVSGNVSSCCGGGIDNQASVTITNSTISGNTTSLGGGGIANNGQLTLISSTVSGNTAEGGGGIYNNGTLTAINSTIADNIAKEGGGAITITRGLATITFCTIYGNSAQDIGGIAIENSSQLTMGGSIAVSNTSATDSNISGNLITGGYNLIQGSSGLQFVDPYNDHSTDIITNTSAGLGIDSHLQNNGGATETLRLLPGSPAIDRIPPNACNVNSTDTISTDQRGIKRPQGVGCDIGAYEYVFTG